MQLPSTKRIRQGGQFSHPIDGTAELAGIELQPGHQCRGQPLSRRTLQIFTVGGNDHLSPLRQSIRHRLKRGGPLLVVRLPQVHRRQTDGAGPLQQLC